MDIKLNQIFNMLDDLSSTELQSVMMRAKVLSEKKKKEEEELREQERIRQEKIAQEKLRQEKIAELQREIQELQNQEVVIPEGSFKAKGSTFVMYDVSKPADNPAPAPSKPAEPVQDEPKNEPIICPNCHQENTPDSGFCLKCGHKLSRPEPSDQIRNEPKNEPIICPNCRQENAPGSGFCLKCGCKFSNPKPQPQTQAASEPKDIICPNCRTVNPANSAFCLSCGNKISQSRSETVPEPSAVSKQQESSLKICYADESMKKWEMLPDEKIVKTNHEVELLKPDKDKKSVYYMTITDKRILFTKESLLAKNTRLAVDVQVGFVGSLVMDSLTAASGKGPKPYLAIPLAAITDCGLLGKKEFFICAGETFVFKNNKYEKIIPDLVRNARM